VRYWVKNANDILNISLGKKNDSISVTPRKAGTFKNKSFRIDDSQTTTTFQFLYNAHHDELHLTEGRVQATVLRVPRAFGSEARLVTMDICRNDARSASDKVNSGKVKLSCITGRYPHIMQPSTWFAFGQKSHWSSWGLFKDIVTGCLSIIALVMPWYKEKFSLSRTLNEQAGQYAKKQQPGLVQLVCDDMERLKMLVRREPNWLDLMFGSSHSSNENVRVCLLVDELDRCKEEEISAILHVVWEMTNALDTLAFVASDPTTVQEAVWNVHRKNAREYMEKVQSVLISLPRPTKDHDKSFADTRLQLRPEDSTSPTREDSKNSTHDNEDSTSPLREDSKNSTHDNAQKPIDTKPTDWIVQTRREPLLKNPTWQQDASEADQGDRSMTGWAKIEQNLWKKALPYLKMNFRRYVRIWNTYNIVRQFLSLSQICDGLVMNLLIMGEQWSTHTAFLLFVINLKRHEGQDKEMMLSEFLKNNIPTLDDIVKDSPEWLGLDRKHESILAFLEVQVLQVKHLVEFEQLILNRDWAVHVHFETCWKAFDLKDDDYGKGVGMLVEPDDDTDDTAPRPPLPTNGSLGDHTLRRGHTAQADNGEQDS
jgi:hypothetical protein